MTSARIGAVCTGAAAAHTWLGRTVRTAIFKTPVPGRVPVRGVNLDGDDQADRRVHGGPDKAVYAYGASDTAWWSRELGRDLPAGTFGENLHVEGLDVSQAVVGERWQVGSALLEVCQPRIPCFKLGLALGDPRFPPRFGDAGRPGAYLRILQEGEVGAGDAVVVQDRPGHDVTVALVSEAYHRDRSLAPRLLEAPQLTASWVEWAADVVARQTGGGR